MKPKTLLICLSLSTLSLTIPQAAQAQTCSDFSSQEEAQAYYNRNGGGNLDRDRDGTACENLPSQQPTYSESDYPSSSSSRAILVGSEPGSRVNVRDGAGTSYYARHYGLVGDRVSVLASTRSGDGYTWYQIQFPASGAIGWVRGDFVQLQ
jgi:Excalibur calcium-binding domain/Bacterial SH3 domain